VLARVIFTNHPAFLLSFLIDIELEIQYELICILYTCDFLVALGLLQTERVAYIKTASSTLIFPSHVLLRKQQAQVFKKQRALLCCSC
jgi:hypothetical protein